MTHLSYRQALKKPLCTQEGPQQQQSLYLMLLSNSRYLIHMHLTRFSHYQVFRKAITDVALIIYPLQEEVATSGTEAPPCNTAFWIASSVSGIRQELNASKET